MGFRSSWQRPHLHENEAVISCFEVSKRVWIVILSARSYICRVRIKILTTDYNLLTWKTAHVQSSMAGSTYWLTNRRISSNEVYVRHNDLLGRTAMIISIIGTIVVGKRQTLPRFSIYFGALLRYELHQCTWEDWTLRCNQIHHNCVVL